MGNPLTGSTTNTGHAADPLPTRTAIEMGNVIDLGTRSRMHERDGRAPGALSRETIIDDYRQYATIYDKLFGSVLEPGRRVLADAVSAAEPQRVLEVGVGFASARLGFRSEFDLGVNVLNHAWHVESIKTVKIFGLSKLVTIRNT